MPYSRAVEERYRLQPADLNGSLEVTVTNVTLQGLERLQPVLHFEGLSKWLTLDDIQSDEMARATGSAVFQDWMGRRLVLTPLEEEDGPRIAISRPGAPIPRPRRRPSPLPEAPSAEPVPERVATPEPAPPEPESQPPTPTPTATPIDSTRPADDPLNSALLIALIALLTLAIIALLLYALGLGDEIWTWLMGG